MSNHVIIRLIRFVPWFTVYLCNAIYFLTTFSTPCKRFTKFLHFAFWDLNKAWVWRWCGTDNDTNDDVLINTVLLKILKVAAGLMWSTFLSFVTESEFIHLIVARHLPNPWPSCETSDPLPFLIPRNCLAYADIDAPRAVGVG